MENKTSTHSARQTYREQFESALACKTREEAENWLRDEIAMYWRDHRVDPNDAEKIIKVNLGYMAGYYSDAIRDQINELFDAPHPIFGTTKPTALDAFSAGRETAVTDKTVSVPQPPRQYWEGCEHQWKAKIDSQFTNEYVTDVDCEKCGVPGEMNKQTKEVFYPAT